MYNGSQAPNRMTPLRVEGYSKDSSGARVTNAQLVIQGVHDTAIL